MRMFFYYFFHSTFNQLRKLLHTWVFLALLAVLTAAGGFMLWIGWYYQRLVQEDPSLPENFYEFVEVSGLSTLNAIELGVGVLVLGILVIQAIGAEKSVSRLFLQADVNLLFASDRSPQAVLSFRVLTTLGPAVFFMVYLLVELILMVRRGTVSPYGAFSVLLAWCLTLGFSVCLKILIYEVGSSHPFFHRNLRWFLFTGLGLMGLVLYRFYKESGDGELLVSLHRFFNAPMTRWIPIWGWIKGTMLYALEGRMALSLCLAVLSLALIGVMAFLVKRLPADYYEETLKSAEEMATLMKEVSSESATLLVMTPRRYREDVNRDGFHRGRGPSVYLFKELYNRRRFSWFGFVTKTTLTYLVVAVFTGLYNKYFLDEPYDFLPVLVLAVIVFFHTIISPVAEDMRKPFFLLEPDSPWVKLFFSLLGGSVCCALDCFLPLMVGSMVSGFSPLRGLCYLPAVVCIDFFAAASGAFVDVSIPASIGISLKQVIQVLLLYAGILLDGMVLAYGIATEHSGIGFVLVTILNLLFGFTFLGLCGVWLYPCRGLSPRSPEYVPDEKGARGAYTQVGISLAGMYCLLHLSQYMLARYCPQWPTFALYAPIYLIGFPVFLLLLRPWHLFTAGRDGGEERSTFEKALSPRQFLLFIPVSLFVVYGGNILGYLLQGMAHLLIPFSLGLSQTGQPSGGQMGLQVLLLVVAAPLMEEFIFRRCVLECLLPYGEKAALFSSALFFGLFHGTWNQLSYGFLLGLVLGYLYIKTRRLRYGVILHMMINAISTLVLPALLYLAASSVPEEALFQVQLSTVITRPGVLLLLIFFFLLFLLSLSGAVLFFFGVREREISGDTVGARCVFTSPGIVALLLVTILGLL